MKKLLAPDYKKTRRIFALTQLGMYLLLVLAEHFETAPAGIAALIAVLPALGTFLLYLKKIRWTPHTALLFKLPLMHTGFFLLSCLLYFTIDNRSRLPVGMEPMRSVLVDAAWVAGQIYALLSVLTVAVLYVIGICRGRIDSEL